MMPCSFTPLTRKTVTGVLFLRTWFRNTSCTFCDFSLDIAGSFFLEPLLGSATRPGPGSPSLRQLITRLGSEAKSQVPHTPKEGGAVQKPQYRRHFRRFLTDRVKRANQNRDASRRQRALDIECGVADEPRCGGFDAAAGERGMDDRGIGFVGARIPRP